MTDVLRSTPRPGHAAWRAVTFATLSSHGTTARAIGNLTGTPCHPPSCCHRLSIKAVESSGSAVESTVHEAPTIGSDASPLAQIPTIPAASNHALPCTPPVPASGSPHQGLGNLDGRQHTARPLLSQFRSPPQPPPGASGRTVDRGRRSHFPPGSSTPWECIRSIC